MASESARSSQQNRCLGPFTSYVPFLTFTNHNPTTSTCFVPSTRLERYVLEHAFDPDRILMPSRGMLYSAVLRPIRITGAAEALQPVSGFHLPIAIPCHLYINIYSLVSQDSPHISPRQPRSNSPIPRRHSLIPPAK